MASHFSHQNSLMTHQRRKKKVPLKLNNFVSICQWPSTDLYNGVCDDAGDLFFPFVCYCRVDFDVLNVVTL